MRKIILDTSSLSAFAQIDRLDILRNTNMAICIPYNVYLEGVVAAASEGYQFPDKIKDVLAFTENELSKKRWIFVLEEEKNVEEFADKHNLGFGESETILIALRKDFIAAIDERKGRSIARRLKIQVTGTIGLIRLAYKEGLINKNELNQILNDLKEKADFRIDEKLIKWILSNI